jgi:chitodextrinase
MDPTMRRRTLALALSALAVLVPLSSPVSAAGLGAAEATVAASSDWQAWTPYSVGDRVTYAGVEYECLQSHTSQPGWEPPNAASLWKKVDGSGGDITAPSVPGGLRSTGTTSSSVSLAWDASSDNVGVTGYNVYRGGAQVASVSGTSYTDSGLSSGTTYSYTVKARDAAGNLSGATNTVYATTATGGDPGGSDPVEPGGWTSYSPSFSIQERGCGVVSNLTFRLTCSTADGDQRAERRYATYTGGSRQFEGYFRITSMGGSRVSLKQTFQTTGPFFMLAVEQGGRLYAVHGGTTIATGATIGTNVRVNTVHVVGSSHRTYINGSLRHSVSSPSGDFYDKFGAYRTASGSGPISVDWTGIRFWRK